MQKGAQPHEPELTDEAPIRTAGITPGPAQKGPGDDKNKDVGEPRR
jgi:hypothetical protein